ncbi:MAG: prolyl oligopeptidase family serine peptidase [Propionibacteriales bacterium]|nr:prolyl oligopeptidase family serine peptidase [Propionibacteriales bacterium]
MTTAPFGSWRSPISASDLTVAALRLSSGIALPDRTLWAEGNPEQRGRVSLWQRDAGGVVSEVTEAATNVRTSVNEYGGGDWTAAEDVVAYTEFADSSVWLIESDQPPRRLAGAPGLRYAALQLALPQRLLLAVREDHRGDGEPIQTVVALALDTANTDGGQVLAAGADFYAHPCLSPSGRLAWCEWDHPDMPWDQSRIVVTDVADPATTTVAAGGAGTSALYPSWAPDGALIYLDDSTGFWNFYRWHDDSTTALCPAEADFCGPLWVLTPVPYAVIDAHRIGCTWLADGFARLGILNLAVGTLTPLATDAVTASVSGNGERAVALLGFADRPAELCELDWVTGATTLLRRASGVHLEPAMVSHAEAVDWDSADGPVHAWFYPPTNPDFRAPDGELPPVQVWSHGGPTAFSDPGFNLAIQYWTSRGIGIVDVNYSGSSGYGRAYRQRLNGNWGISDVRDCIAATSALVEAGRADPRRLSIRGGSAGGYTTLAALTTSSTFAAGISLYGIGDLESLVADTHKFEAHYTDRLVAPYPDGRATYVERSPIHHLDRLRCPMLIFQGADDKVVPPSQAEAMAAALTERGLPVRLHLFEGEGHGFRQAQTIITVAQEALAFLAEVHKFRPAD